jgi:hypothetical protein
LNTYFTIVLVPKVWFDDKAYIADVLNGYTGEEEWRRGEL